MPYSLVSGNMTFHASQLVIFSTSVTRTTFSHFVRPFNIFSCCFPLLHFPLIIPVATWCSSLSLLITWCKKVTWYLCILCMSDHVVSASLTIVLFDFYAAPNIRSILCSNHISAAFSFFCSYIEMVLTSIHQNWFNIALQGSVSCMNRDVVVCLYWFHFLEILVFLHYF